MVRTKADLEEIGLMRCDVCGQNFNGRQTSQLPVERPTKFGLVINLKTAKQIGLTIPQSVLYRADKVIK